jgi:GT2 family glycosyltransferase
LVLMTPNSVLNVAIVVIGRNEGDRLKRSLASVKGIAPTVVYVDSGSVDGSAEYAAEAGFVVVELDASQPFSAARARNEGSGKVAKIAPEAPFIQFLDGDCDLIDGWLEAGVAALGARQDVAAVCGQVREIHPESSVYNRLCGLEWRQEPGETRTCGGRFMVRSEVFRTVGGFRADVIAAEDDEFFVRVRQLGWKILQLDQAMASHDAAMTRFSQWWRKARRTGHAYAQVAALHGQGEERYFVDDCRKIWIWGLLLPVAALGLAAFTHGLSLLAALAAYAMQFVRIYGHGRRRGWQAGDAAIFSFFTVISRAPALLGMLAYHWRQWRGKALTIIEYKGSSTRA